MHLVCMSKQKIQIKQYMMFLLISLQLMATLRPLCVVVCQKYALLILEMHKSTFLLFQSDSDALNVVLIQ